MTDRTIESLLSRRALAEKATPGPWEADYRGCYIFTPRPEEIMVAEMRGTGDGLSREQQSRNAAYISANSPDVVMDDINEILRLRDDVERLECAADWLAKMCSLMERHNFPEDAQDAETWRKLAMKTTKK